MGESIATKSRQDAGHQKLLEAAREAFAAHGYEGASLRSISANAGMLHTAMLYHFKNKDMLWKAVMTDMFEEFSGRYQALEQELAGASADTQARFMVREFVAFCAVRPELHRIMTNEGRSDTERLTWLVENYTRPLFESVAAVAASLQLSPILADPVRLYYAIIGLAASTFTLAPEFRLLSGRDPFEPKEISDAAALVEQLIFGPEPQK